MVRLGPPDASPAVAYQPQSYYHLRSVQVPWQTLNGHVRTFHNELQQTTGLEYHIGDAYRVDLKIDAAAPAGAGQSIYTQTQLYTKEDFTTLAVPSAFVVRDSVLSLCNDRYFANAQQVTFLGSAQKVDVAQNAMSLGMKAFQGYLCDGDRALKDYADFNIQGNLFMRAALPYGADHIRGLLSADVRDQLFGQGVTGRVSLTGPTTEQVTNRMEVYRVQGVQGTQSYVLLNYASVMGGAEKVTAVAVEKGTQIIPLPNVTQNWPLFIATNPVPAQINE